MKNHYIPPEKFPLTLSSHVSVLGNYFFNLFLVCGNEKSVLFEVGVSGTVDTVIRQLESLGKRPDILIPSHPHSDHITGLPGLVQAFPNAEIMAAKGAGKFVMHPKAGPGLIREDRFISEGLTRFGLDPGRPSLSEVPDLSEAIEIDSEQTMDLGGVTMELIPVGGHSPGNLIARVNPGNIVFCSDSLGFHFPGRKFLPLFFTAIDAYTDTLNRIQALSPEILCPAHQGPITGDQAGEAIRQAVSATKALIRDIRESDQEDETLAQQIFNENYRDEFTLYTRENIANCAALMVKRAKES